jgi:hypothetical protein
MRWPLGMLFTYPACFTNSDYTIPGSRTSGKPFATCSEIDMSDRLICFILDRAIN